MPWYWLIATFVGIVFYFSVNIALFLEELNSRNYQRATKTELFVYLLFGFPMLLYVFGCDIKNNLGCKGG